MLSSGDLDLRSGTRDFLFLLAAGLRDLGAGLRSLGSGVAGFGFPHPGSIYTYSRSTAPAAVINNPADADDANTAETNEDNTADTDNTNHTGSDI